MELGEYMQRYCLHCDHTYDCDCFWIDSIIQCSKEKNIEINGLMELI